MSRNKWKAVDLSLQFSIKSDWSKEEADTPLSDVNSIRSSLPTKTSATRQTAELDNIPENGPFILNFANIPFESTESELRQFFRTFDICEIEFNSTKRGCGYISFSNINDLTGAWKCNEKMFLSRPIRLSIPLKEDAARQQAMSSRPKYQNQQRESVFTGGDNDNWRNRKTTSDSKSSCIDNDQSNWRSKIATSNDNIDQSNWRNNRPTAAISDSKSNDNSAWRVNTPRQPTSDKTAWRSRESTAVNTNDNDNWRSRDNHPEPRIVAPNVDGKSNWRPHSDSNKRIVPEIVSGGDNWRRARPAEDTKIEYKKLSNSVAKPNAWGNKKPITIAEKPSKDSVKSDFHEWTLKQTTNSPLNRSRVTSDDQKDSIIAKVNESASATVENPPKKPQLAPPPAFNVWEERKKSRATKSTKITGDQKVIEGEVPSRQETGSANVTKDTDNNNSNNNNNNTTTATSNEDTEQHEPLSKPIESLNTKVAPRHTVVISVNGPYLDPKSHRTLQPHPGTDINTKPPIAIPVTKSVINPALVTSSVSQSKDSGPTTTISNTTLTNSRSSWARGPPRGLLEKHVPAIIPNTTNC